MSPQRIQLRRTKGWRKPEGAVVVSRPSKWGNPHQVVADRNGWMVLGNGWLIRGTGEPLTKHEACELAVDMYRRMYPPGSNNAYMARIQLRGKDLACWCPLVDAQCSRVPCHADVLLEIANGEPE